MIEEKQRLQLEKEFKEKKIPFAIDKSVYKQFSERNTIFARVVWDKSFSSYRKSITERAASKIGMKGYSRIEYATQDASWTVYDHFRGAFDWNDVKESIESSPTQLSSHFPKYDESNIDMNSKTVKRVAQIYGACGVGITELDESYSFIYSHDRHNNPIKLPKGIKYAIVMLVEMDYHAIKSSPTLPASIATGNAYSRMAFLIACMAQFIRHLGYRAIPAGNDTGLSVPLAIQAGLGQFGRNGLLTTPIYGQRVRICKVYTDFPMKIDKPIDFGVTEFCTVCKKCAKYCPSQSIPYDHEPTWKSPWNSPSNNNGTYKWYVNVDTCYDYWVKNTSDCSNCIRVCPFTKPLGYVHDIARFFIKRFRFLDRMWIVLDDIMAKFPWWNYGKKHDPNKFWNSRKYLNKKV